MSEGMPSTSGRGDQQRFELRGNNLGHDDGGIAQGKGNDVRPAPAIRHQQLAASITAAVRLYAIQAGNPWSWKKNRIRSANENLWEARILRPAGRSGMGVRLDPWGEGYQRAQH